MNISFLRPTFSLLNTDYVQLNKNWNYKNVTSTFYRIYYIDAGEGKLYNPAETVKLEKGYLYLIPSFTTCNYYCETYLSQYYISFIEESANGLSLFSSNRKIFKLNASTEEISAIKRVLKLNPDRGLRNSNNPKVYEKSVVLKNFQELNNLMQPWAYMETCGLLMQLLSRFLASGTFLDENKSIINSKISDTINYIQTNLQSEITVTELAKRTNLQSDYFSRLFYENTGERPLAYIQSKRIERAQLLLITTDLPFYEIASETGFQSLSYFSRTFRNMIGQTPGEYKKENMVI